MGRVMNQIRRGVVEAAPHLDTAGPAEILSFSTDMASPAKSLVVGMEPIQDLHGYDSPWPAGGGKNKLKLNVSLPVTLYGVSITVVDGAIVINGTATENFNQNLDNWASDYNLLPVTVGTNYLAFSCSATNVPADYTYAYIQCGYFLNSTPTQQTCSFNSSKVFTINVADASDIVYTRSYINIRGGVTYNNMTLKIQAEIGENATAWTPYTNLCPITGLTGVTVERTGQNLLNPDLSAWSTGRNYKYINGVVPHGQMARLTFEDKDASADVSGCYIGFVHDNLSSTDNASIFRWVVNNGEIRSNMTNVSNQDNTTLCENVFIYPNTEETLNKIYARWNVMVELGSTASPYTPFVGTTYPVTWQTEAGTVYGGTVDVVSGLLTVTMAMVDLGSLTYSKSSIVTNGFVATGGMPDDFPLAPSSMAVPDWLCSQYTAVSNVALESSSVDFAIAWRISGQNKGVIVKDSNYSAFYTGNDMASFKAAMDGVQLCYEIAEPIPFTIPATQIQLLKGANTLWSGSNSVTVKFWTHI